MNVEYEVIENDRLTAFCKHCILRNAGSWPPDETFIAKEFVNYFGVRFLLHSYDLRQLCSELKIELSTDDLPDGVYGSNFCFGRKRVVVLKRRNQLPGMHTHTAFHEIREVMEYSFIELRFPTLEVELKETQADEFASLVMLFASEDIWSTFVDRAREISSPWRKAGAFGLIGIGTLMFCVSLLFTSMFPDLDDLKADIRARNVTLHNGANCDLPSVGSQRG